MNKVAFFIFTVFTLIGFQSKSEPFLFITHSNFQILTASEQKIYLKALSEMILQLDQDLQNEYLTSHPEYSLNPIFNLFIQEAFAQQVTPSRQYSSNPREESAKIGIMMSIINGQMRSVQDMPSNKITKQRLEDDYFETLKRLYTLSEKKLDNESIRFTKRNIETMRNFWPSLTQVNPDLNKFKVNTFRRLDLTAKNVNLNNSKIEPTTSIKAPTTKTKNTENKSIVPTQNPLPELRCLYAGFVIRQTACTPLKTLPEDFTLDPLTKENFRCSNEKEILCNPLLFGSTEENKPYCTVRSTTATKNCQDLSNHVENQKRILNLWKNPKNQKSIDQFQKDLQSLCQDETRNNDVKSTCKVALKQFNEKIKRDLPASIVSEKIDSNKENKVLGTTQ